MSLLLAVLILLIPLTLLAAMVSLIEWPWLGEKVSVPRSGLVGLLLVLTSDWVPPLLGGVFTLVGIGLFLRPWVRRRFGLEAPR
jgi:hypothetical protein